MDSGIAVRAGLERVRIHDPFVDNELVTLGHGDGLQLLGDRG